MNQNLGCIDPHGMYPFPKDRESCPKCQAIRAQQKPSLRRGLPYRWWTSATFWDIVMLLGLAIALALIFAAWFLDWQPVW